MTPEIIIAKLEENPSEALEFYYEGHDDVACWCYMAPNNIPVVYWNAFFTEQVSGSRRLELMLKDKPGVHSVAKKALADARRFRVAKRLGRIFSEPAEQHVQFHELRKYVEDNLWKYVKGRDAYLCGLSSTDEDLYWILCDVNGNCTMSSAVGKLEFVASKPLLRPSEHFLSEAREKLNEKLRDTCDIIFAGPFSTMP